MELSLEHPGCWGRVVEYPLGMHCPSGTIGFLYWKLGTHQDICVVALQSLPFPGPIIVTECPAYERTSCKMVKQSNTCHTHAWYSLCQMWMGQTHEIQYAYLASPSWVNLKIENDTNLVKLQTPENPNWARTTDVYNAIIYLSICLSSLRLVHGILICIAGYKWVLKLLSLVENTGSDLKIKYI